MLLYNNIILGNDHFSSALILNFDRKISCSVIDEEIQKSRVNREEPKFIVLDYSQYSDLNRELTSQRRFMGIMGIIEVKDLYLPTYRGIPVFPVIPKNFIHCPLCNSSTWRKNNLIYSCDKHYKQILAMNRLAANYG